MSAAEPPAMCPLLGDNITDDTLLHIASFLPTAKDLLSLWLSNRRFSIKCIAGAPGGERGAAAPPEMLCIAEEAGRLWVAGCTEQERGWVSRRDRASWLGLMKEVGVLQQPRWCSVGRMPPARCLRTGRWRRGALAGAGGPWRAR